MELKQICCRKDYKDISTERILKDCVENRNKKTDILAIFMSEDSTEILSDKFSAVPNHKVQYVNNEFCLEENLSKFNCIILEYYLIYKKKQSGLFQKFVYPLDDKNYIIEVEWKNKVVQLSRKTNIHYINDKIEAYKKLVTNEYGYDHHTTSSNLSNERIVKNLKEVCAEIKRRVNAIYYYKHNTVIRGQEMNKDTDFDKYSGSKISNFNY